VALSKILLLTVLILGCFCYEQSNLEEKSISQSQKTELIKEADIIISYVDSVLKNGKYPQLRVFAEVEDAPTKYIEIEDLDNWPENTVTSINVVYDEKQKPVAYKEIISSGSGDCSNSYCTYFSKNGEIKAFKRTSFFFNDICGEGPISEKNWFYFDKKLNKIYEKYELLDGSGIPIDSTKCGEIICRFDYKVYKTFSRTPLVKKGILK